MTKDEINKRIGMAIRARRNFLGFSQEKLAKALGITFQQVQKYEKGSNSVNIHMLHQTGAALGINAAEFLKSVPATKSSFSERATLEMMKAFNGLKPHEKKAISRLMQSLAIGAA